MKETLAAINRVFSRHGDVAIAVVRNPLNNQPVVSITDTYVKLPIVPAKGVTYQTISKLLPELEDAVGRIYKKRMKLRFGMNPFCLEIPRITPEYTPLQLTDDLSPFESRIGNTFQYGDTYDVRINLTDSNSAHVFVAGMVGCGKSNVLEALLLSIAYSTNPSDLSIFMIDMKKRSLANMIDLPHVVACASTEEDAEAICSHVFGELIRRRDQANLGAEKILLIIDELRELKFANSSVLKNELPRIVSLGREIGIHVVAATQKPSSADLGSIVNSQFPIRIVGVVEDAQASYHLLKKPGAGAESLIGKGDMLISFVGTDPLRMQAYLVEDTQPYVNQVIEKWGSNEQKDVFQSVPHVGNAGIPEHVEKVFWEYYDSEKNKLKHGGLTKLAEAWYGKRVDVQGHIYRDMMKLCMEIKSKSKT